MHIKTNLHQTLIGLSSTDTFFLAFASILSLSFRLALIFCFSFLACMPSFPSFPSSFFKRIRRHCSLSQEQSMRCRTLLSSPIVSTTSKICPPRASSKLLVTIGTRGTRMPRSRLQTVNSMQKSRAVRYRMHSFFFRLLIGLFSHYFLLPQSLSVCLIVPQKNMPFLSLFFFSSMCLSPSLSLSPCLSLLLMMVTAVSNHLANSFFSIFLSSIFL